MKRRELCHKTPERGDLYYIRNSKFYMDGKGGNRPGIVISENMMNSFSDRVMVVYTTTQQKSNDMNVPLMVNTTQSYAICENISTIYKDRLETYIGRVTEEEMQAVERQIKKGLGLQEQEGSWKDKPLCIGCQEKENYAAMAKKAEGAALEAKVYKRMFDELLKKVTER